jgi:hypothetical protein
LNPLSGGIGFAYRYNGLGLRTQQVMGAGLTTTTDYLLDLAAPLPSVLWEISCLDIYSGSGSS